MPHWILPTLATALGLATLGLALALSTVRRRAHGEVAQARTETAQLRDRIADIEARLAPPETSVVTTQTEFVITELGNEPEAPPSVPTRIEGRLFADVVLRESVVKGASWVHGIRRGLEPENRWRMRHAFRTEVKRSRKQRRADLREARRLVARRRRLREDLA